jgi:hypothetical protein
MNPNVYYLSARRRDTRQMLAELAVGSLTVLCLLSAAVWAFRSQLAFIAV